MIKPSEFAFSGELFPETSKLNVSTNVVNSDV